MPRISFTGKTFVQNHHLNVKFHELIPNSANSLTDKVSLNDNLVIQGDNLKGLKALLPTYAGKVKCVVIDPPYNTGSEKWVYNDNVNSPRMQEWLGQVVDKDDLSKHDKWLCMMMPRLKLLKELMAKDGLIAMCIDDHEVQHAIMLMNEIFGSENHIATAPWLSEPSGGKEKTGLRTGHEYVLIYHNGDGSNISRQEVSVGELDSEDEFGKYRKGRELRKWGGTSLRSDRPGQWFGITAPNGTVVYPIKNDGEEGHWRWGKDNEEMKKILANPNHAEWELRPYDSGVTYNGESERWVPYEKIRDKEKTLGWKTWLDDMGTNASGTKSIKEIFGSKIFDTPKPVKLYKWLIGLHEDQDAIVLDSFAGSGTTAQAVLELNKEDGGTRQFIVVEMEDYANEVTAERVRRVIKGVPKSKNPMLQEGLGGSFSYFTLGEPIEMESILFGKDLPSYENLARYVFYTATGEEFDIRQVDEERNYIGSSREYDVFFFYKPELDYLKSTSLNLEVAKSLGDYTSKKKLVFAPMKYLDDSYLHKYNIEFSQLPFEIYRLKD
ncbi:site-specific DNA-methyltransferase [Exiguobacterium sp. s189]|uniref:site-specific DNA-methyltransferase n=1 Tax=Exiguobacterium sp. s189 TaxID=2751263 RepID=UPI001BEA50F7|nr:site-specific DNA-methyltransferase [Exiguobacterium sp. s189]